MVVQTISVINPTSAVYHGTSIVLSIVAASLVIGLIWSWPRPITQDYSAPNIKVSIVEGDILAEKTHLVIGTNDTFDTQTPNIISNNSLQGQVLQVLYNGDLKELDSKLATSLADKVAIDSIAKLGKQVRYGVGTIATVTQAARLIFFLAYGEMDLQNAAHSTPDKIWKSLLSLWDEVSKRGNGGVVSMPVIGGGQSRLSSILPAQDAIRLTLLSFMFASRYEKVCDELRIVVKPEIYEKLDHLELQSFLSSLRSS